MYIRELGISKFRAIQEQTVYVGRYITVLAGHNATGKSTVLAMLGHCAQKPGEKTPTGLALKSNLNDIIKFSSANDLTITKACSFHFEDRPQDALDEYPEVLDFRTTWQKYGDVFRYRIIPVKTATRNNEKKLTWPTFYLGLTRLYPVGEADAELIDKARVLTDDDVDFLLDNYMAIFSMQKRPIGYKSISISETEKKRGVGIETESYDPLSNSAGEDNLGQIIMSVLSFRKLKEKKPDSWIGGILLIDEIDASLHPIAQNKLFDFLLRQAKQIGIQIVFSTHSLSLLEYICSKTEHNNPDTQNPISLAYFYRTGETVKILRDPMFNAIYLNLMNEYEGGVSSARKISVYSEDAEARFFMSKLLNDYLSRLNFLELKMGKDQLLSMLVQDYRNLSRCMFVLDGDCSDDSIQDAIRKSPYRSLDNIIKLPGDGCSPEELLWGYIKNIDDDHALFIEGFKYGWNKTSFFEHGPESSFYSGLTEKRDKYKKWFNDNQGLIDTIINFWIRDNQEQVDAFCAEFVTCFNQIAARNMIPIICK